MNGGDGALLPSAPACFRSGLASFRLTPLRDEQHEPCAFSVLQIPSGSVPAAPINPPALSAVG